MNAHFRASRTFPASSITLASLPDFVITISKTDAIAVFIVGLPLRTGLQPDRTSPRLKKHLRPQIPLQPLAQGQPVLVVFLIAD